MGRWYGQAKRKDQLITRKENEMDVNQVTLLGRIGSEIQTKNIGGNYLAEFSLATSRKWKNKSGELQEKTEWHNISTWGNTAKILKEKTGKGKRVLVQGEVQYQTWDKEDGSKGYKTVINALNVSIIDFLENNSKTSQSGNSSIMNNDYKPQTDAAFTVNDIPF